MHPVCLSWHRGRCNVEREEGDCDDDREAGRELHKFDKERQHSPLGGAARVIFLIVHNLFALLHLCLQMGDLDVD